MDQQGEHRIDNPGIPGSILGLGLISLLQLTSDMISHDHLSLRNHVELEVGHVRRNWRSLAIVIQETRLGGPTAEI